MLKLFNINSKAITRISSSLVILTAAIVSNSSVTFAESNILETEQTESVPTVAFRRAPRLLDISTTFNKVGMRNATYYFDVDIPEDSGASLQKVEIELRRGQDDIDYKLEKTVAYLGTSRRRKDQLTIETVSLDEDTGIITVEFAKALAPGSKFTVGLKPKRNPYYDGVYVFGVTVFPQGENPYGLYLGSRNLNFYSGYDGFFGH